MPNEKQEASLEQLTCVKGLNWGGLGRGPYLTLQKAYCSRRERTVLAIVRWDIEEGRGVLCNPQVVGEVPKDPHTLELVESEPVGKVYYRGGDNDELLSAKDAMEIRLKSDDNRGKSTPITKRGGK